jgi:parvulin-like peptidyl-prolyl isomerase
MNRLFLSAVALIAASASFGQVDNGAVVATINGEEIKGAEYYRRMEYLPGVGKIMGGGFVENSPGFWALEALITERLIVALAKEKNVTPTPAEVQAELRNRLEADPKLLEDWEASGQTRAEFERQIFIQLCQFKISTAGVTVTDQEVENFYKQNPFSFTIPKRVKLRVIAVTDPAKKAQVDIQLQSGKTFSDVAKAMSDDISKATGGEFGTVPISSLQENFRKAVENLKIGQVSPWMEGGGQNIKFLLEDVVPEKLQPLDAVLKRTIRRKLMMDKGRVKNDVAKDMAAIRAKAKVDIKRKDLALEYEKMMKRMEVGAGKATP